MKKMIVMLALLLATGGAVRAQMQAMFGYSKFFLTEKGQPYVETYLQFDAWTMQFRAVEGGYRADAEVTLVLRQQDSVCYVKKYDLSSPTVADLEHLDFSFLDVQRFSVGNGIYTLDMTLRDKGSEAPASTVSEKLVVNYSGRQPSLSSLLLLASMKPTQKENILSRGGYDMEPYVSDFMPEQVKQLQFYYEVYDIDGYFPKASSGEAVLTVAYIEELETGRRVEGSQVVQRRQVATTMAVPGSLDISGLPSGNYNLVCEVRDRNNNLLLYSKLPFFRSNPEVKGVEMGDYATSFAGKITDESLMNLYLDALYPLASETEKGAVAGLVRRPGLAEKQEFLYHFWTLRNPMSPEAEWLKYKERIDYVQAHYSYPMTRGIMTDRGRVYLTYGAPDFIRDEKNFAIVGHSTSRENRSSTITDLGNRTYEGDGVGVGQVFYLPYQLWRYNRISGDAENRVFIFWDEHRSGNYQLLHSNARGEVHEADWERRLSRQQIPEGEVGEVGRQFNRGY
ncbi:MAG: GWxTD domain-containing protein [Bacteroidales bacterium]|nr:GWxTD domain-containing protein [Bacteroidales bacterium]